MRVIIVLLICAGLACIPASIANRKGYSFAGFWCLSFFLSFLIGLIVAACLSDRSDYVPRYELQAEYASRPVLEKRCKKCGANINEEDTFCRKCGADQTEKAFSDYADIPVVISEQTGERSYYIKDMPVYSDSIVCPACETVQRSNRSVCYHCGAKFIR